MQRNLEAVPEAGRTKTVQTSEGRLSQGTIPISTFATEPLTTSSTLHVETPQNYMVGQQRRQISELQFDKFLNPQSCSVWKTRFKTQVTTCSDFPSYAILWIKEVEMVDPLDDLISSGPVCGKDFPKWEMLDVKIDSALNKITQDFQFKEKVSLEEQKAQKEDRLPRGRQKFCDQCRIFHLIVSWKVCANRGYVSLRNSERCLK